MYKEGLVEITSELTLKDFEWKIKGVTYDWERGKALIEVLMWEKEYKHSRTFEFDSEEEMLPGDCMNLILGMAQFKNSI